MAKKLSKAKLNYKKHERKILSGNVRREGKNYFCEYCEAKTREDCFCHREDATHPYSDDAFLP